jgi:hypothetical protein
MTRPYSEDIRERALARADAGQTVRSIAEALQISPSCVTKWKNLRRDTGKLAPGKIGGHKKRVLSDAGCAELRFEPAIGDRRDEPPDVAFRDAFPRTVRHHVPLAVRCSKPRGRAALDGGFREPG